MKSYKTLTSNYIGLLPKQLKFLIATFLLVLSIGYFSGLTFVQNTTGVTNKGIIENYMGNEDNEDAEEMKFKKSGHEMLNIIHTHILSMSIIFLVLGFLTFGVKINDRLKRFLMIEPLLSVLATFGSIYLMWFGISWMSYITMVSGGLMTSSFILSVLLIYRDLIYGSGS